MEEFQTEDRNQINIAILGAVSAGKSTLLNSVFSETYSQCKIIRTTMVPQVYYEGVYIGGYNELMEYLNKPLTTQSSDECRACEG